MTLIDIRTPFGSALKQPVILRSPSGTPPVVFVAVPVLAKGTLYADD
jgi:hypothetical protein